MVDQKSIFELEDFCLKIHYEDSIIERVYVIDFHLNISDKIRPKSYDSEFIINNLIKAPQSTILKVVFSESAYVVRSEILGNYGVLLFAAISDRLFTSLRHIVEFNYSHIPNYFIWNEVKRDDCENQTIKTYSIDFSSPEEVEYFPEFFLKILSSLNSVSITPIELKLNSNKILQRKYAGLKILQSNTKARRLGYLKFIIQAFSASNYFPVNYFNRKIELDIQSINPHLLEYKNNYNGDDKGLVSLSNNGISVEPYLHLMKQLNILTEVNRSYILTKQTKVFFIIDKLYNGRVENRNQIIDEQKEKSSFNVFDLNILDRIYFLNQILISDSLYICSLLEVILILYNNSSSAGIKKVFKEYLLDELARISNSPDVTLNSIKRDVVELRKRIQSWTKAEVYLEHIIEPRLNWLLDLKLIVQIHDKNKKYRLTDSGTRLLNYLSGIYESVGVKHIYLPELLLKDYFTLFSYIYDLKAKAIFDEPFVLEKLEQSFILFKTDAPNRITASQAINFVCYTALIEKNITIEFNEVKDYLLKGQNKEFLLDWFHTENDGSLSKRRK